MSGEPSISQKKIEANHRNALRSTGPKTQEGKERSRANALKHGLCGEVVVTQGDYREDLDEYVRLRADLREYFKPIGMFEDLQVEQMARCYWRRLRAAQYEAGAIQRQGDATRRCEEQNREARLAVALDLEQSSPGIAHLIEGLEGITEEMQGGVLSAGSRNWLMDRFPDTFLFPDKAPDATLAGGQRGAVVSEEEMQLWLQQVAAERARLLRREKRVAKVERAELEAKLRCSALPDHSDLAKLLRYEAANERQLDRALAQLERLQARRRAGGAAREAGGEPGACG